jgi:outer membrane protein assembly factor BamA
MKMKQNLLSLFLSLLLLIASAPAQKSASNKGGVASERKLVAVKVTGTERYNDKEIVPASGLQLGENVGDADFKEAARRLGDTGMFTEVSYSFSYSAAGTKLELQLKDADEKKLVPAHFENFVWFKDADLISELQRRVSLFKLALPVGGTLLDRTVEALQVMLDEKQVPGRVSYLRESPQEGGALTGIAFQVDDIDIRIRDVEFPGAAPDHLPLLRQASRKLLGAQYTRSPLAIVARVDYLPIYLQRGYLEASFAPSEARVATQSQSQVEVDAIFPVTPGKVYSTSEVAWKGNAALPTSQLQPLIHLPAGQPANAVRLAEDLEKVARLYRTRGYMNVHIRSAPLMNEEKNTVHYDLNVVEGDQYKMGELELQGLDSQSTARLREAWTLREGEPYNADYPNKFVDGSTKLLPGGVHWGISVHESVNSADKTVDVTIHFTPR